MKNYQRKKLNILFVFVLLLISHHKRMHHKLMLSSIIYKKEYTEHKDGSRKTKSKKRKPKNCYFAFCFAKLHLH